MSARRYFHLHLVSDTTGATLINVGRAAASQYTSTHSIEHVHPLVRSQTQIERVLRDIEETPGIVLYTLIDADLAAQLEQGCRELGVPCASVLDPILSIFQSYLGARSAGRVGAQHVLDADYFRRIEALNFTMAHDDGQLVEEVDEAFADASGTGEPEEVPEQTRA